MGHLQVLHLLVIQIMRIQAMKQHIWEGQQKDLDDGKENKENRILLKK